MIKNFSYKEYSNDKLFTNIGKRVELKEYRNNLIFYNSCNTNQSADFCYENAIPEVTGTAESLVENLNNGTFGQYIKNSGTLTFDKENFYLLKNEGSFKFRLGTCIENSYGYQSIILKDVFTIITGEYSFNLTVGAREATEVLLSLTVGMTRTNILNAILVAIDPSYNASVDVSSLTNVLIKSDYYGDQILITSGVTGTDLLSIFSVSDPTMANAPIVRTKFFSFENGVNNYGKIDFVHYKLNEQSMIDVIFYNNLGVLTTTLTTIWNNVIEKLYSFELDFNNDLAYLFLEGKLVSFEKTGFERENNDCLFKISSGGVDFPYNFDEIILYSIVMNSSTYDIETVPLNKYSTEIPFIDYHFSNGFIEGTIEQCFLDCSNNISFVLYSGEIGYYYMAGSWRISDGTFYSSTDAPTFETKIISFPFVENKDVKIRAFFESEGTNLCYLEDFEIIIETALIDESGALPAILLGTVLLNNVLGTGLDLTGIDSVIISTDVGNTTIDLTTNAAYQDSVLAQEIVDSINAADPAGILRADLNSLNQVYLTGTTKGVNGSISVSGDCATLVFGGEITALGQSAVISPVDYSILFGYVKRKLGYPTVPVEITDEQMQDVLKDAVNLYNKWRNYSVQTLYIDLAGTSTEGYEIPAIIGSERNIIDVVFKPRTPFGIYDTNNFEYNVYIQQLFNKYGRGGARTGFLADYSISMNFIADSNLILGTEPRWEIRDKKLFCYPKPPSGAFNVGIKYKGTMTIEEVMSDSMVKQYMTGACRKIIGTIRSTFGGLVSAGDTTLQLNGTEMVTIGTEEMEAALKDMRGESEPLMMIVG